MKKILIANWKMNPAAAVEAVALAKKIERAARRRAQIEVVVAPPAPFLIPVARVLKMARLGAQDAFWEDAGAYTGEVSPSQLESVGVLYVIVGHSERRMLLGETDDMIAKKLRASARRGMTAILCVGERERAGGEVAPEVGDQLRNALAGITKPAFKNIVVCYEPVWAISTSAGARPAEADDVFRASVYIRRIAGNMVGREAARGLRIIYGGSVDAGNIAEFLDKGRVDGALVGEASLDPEEFGRIIDETASAAG